MSVLASSSSSPSGSIVAQSSSTRSESSFQPSTKPITNSEWQLYSVLQRANLLQYYDIFISQGGDDVHQLLEAGEEEFLEIMALVGMASKPLHVRRLQKALQEFARHGMQLSSNPSGPVLPTLTANKSSSASSLPITCSSPSNDISNSSPSTAQGWLSAGATANVLPGAYLSTLFQGSLPIGDMHDTNSLFPIDAAYPSGGPSPSLTMAQVDKIQECAREVAKTVPEVEPKLVQNKKKVSRDLLAVMEMPASHPHRMEEFRRYAAIYGRFDAKRKADKPLTLHEVSVNEAAAQLCLMRPALLTRRDELFPMARQVVRDAGYNYAKGTSSSRHRTSETEMDELGPSPYKRSTPADSVTDSGDERGATPSSCAGEPSVASPPSVNHDHTINKQTIINQLNAEITRSTTERDACQQQAVYAIDPTIAERLRMRADVLTQTLLALKEKQATLLADNPYSHENSQMSNDWKCENNVFAVVKEEFTESDQEEARDDQANSN